VASQLERQLEHQHFCSRTVESNAGAITPVVSIELLPVYQSSANDQQLCGNNYGHACEVVFSSRLVCGWKSKIQCHFIIQLKFRNCLCGRIVNRVDTESLPLAIPQLIVPHTHTHTQYTQQEMLN